MFFKKKSDVVSEQIERLCTKRLSSVVERVSGEERTLGKGGGASVVGAELVIVCNGTEVFRCDIAGCVVAELMSGNGCDIKGVSGGVKRHVIAYYSKNK